MNGTRQADPFYLESSSGELYTSPFLLALATVPSKLPLAEKGLIGEKSSSCHLIGARWYDAELGLFMSVDPAGQYANPYSYGPNSPVNGTDPTGMVWDVFRPSKWGNFFDDVGKEANEYTEKAYNKYFNDECNYEANEHCRGRIQEAVGSSNAVEQLLVNCQQGGDQTACSTLDAIGYSSSPHSFSHGFDRKLAVYIFESRTHKIGATLTVGGGKAAPTVQYDDKTIPLGVYDFSGASGRNESIERERAASEAVFQYHLARETLPGDNVFASAGPMSMALLTGVKVEMYSPSMCMSQCLDDPTVNSAWLGLGLSVPGASIPKFGRAASLSSAMGGSPWTTPLSLAQYYIPALAPGARQLGRRLNPVSNFTAPFFAGYLMGYYATCAMGCYDEPSQ